LESETVNLLSPTEVKALLARHGLRPKKRLGQNFLIDRNVLGKIIAAAELDASSGVLEIGPGLGTVTAEAALIAEKVVAVETDRDMVGVLGETVGDLPNVEVVEADFLNLSLDAFLPEKFADRKCIVVANLPYYITSPLITRLIEARRHVERMVVMVQAEVADRLIAAAGSDAYGSLSVFVQYHCRVEVVAKVKRTVFLPPPEVDSSVVRLDMREAPPVDTADEATFFRVVRAAFGQRRKTLLKALSGSPDLCWTRERAAAVLSAAQIDPTRRGETLSIEEFARIANASHDALAE
jgi:16S rRNA (adenine1518-N6/adenine1519-N6)-dimethyltransferase